MEETLPPSREWESLSPRTHLVGARVDGLSIAKKKEEDGLNDTIIPVSNLSTREEDYLPSGLETLDDTKGEDSLDQFQPPREKEQEKQTEQEEPFAFLSLDLDDNDKEVEGLRSTGDTSLSLGVNYEKQKSRKELREERMHKAFLTSKEKYKSEAGYTESGWFVAQKKHPHDFDTLLDRDDPHREGSSSALERGRQGEGEGEEDEGDGDGDGDGSGIDFDERMIEFNLARSYHSEQYLSALAILLPLLNLSIPSILLPLTYQHLSNSYPLTKAQSQSNDYPARLVERLRSLGSDHTAKDSQNNRAMWDIGMRSGVKILKAQGRLSTAEMEGGNLETESVSGESLSVEEIKGLKEVVGEIADRTRLMWRKSGNSAVAEEAGKTYLAIGKPREACLAFLLAILDRGPCRSYFIGLQSALREIIVSSNQDSTLMTNGVKGAREAIVALSLAVDYLEEGSRPEAGPLFGVSTKAITSMTDKEWTRPGALEEETISILSEWVTLPLEPHQKDRADQGAEQVEVQVEKDMIARACSKLNGWVTARFVGRGRTGGGSMTGVEDQGERPERSVRTL